MIFNSKRFSVDFILQMVGILLGFLVATITAACSGMYIMANAGFYWLSQVIVLGVLACLNPSKAVIGGVAIGLGCYLAAFAIWLFSSSHPESMTWLFYLFSLPGALIGGCTAHFLVSRLKPLTSINTAFMAFGLTIAGVAVNQTVIWFAIFYQKGR